MKSILVTLLVILALSSFLIIKHQGENLRKQNLKSNLGDNPIVTYIYNSTVNSKQYVQPQDQAQENIMVQVSAACQLSINHTIAKKQYIIYAQYDNFDVKKLQVEDGTPVGDFIYSNESDDQILYIATLNDQTGQLLSLQVPKQIDLDYSDLMKFVTIEILRLAFPQIKKHVSENVGEIEEHRLGQVRPHFQTFVTGNNLVSRKWFTQDDFVSLKYEIGAQQIPEIFYELVSTIDSETQQVLNSQETHQFAAATNVEYNVVRKEDGEYDTKPIVIQNAEVTQDTTMQLIKFEYDDSQFDDIQAYISQTEFQELDIKDEQGEAKIYNDNVQANDIPPQNMLFADPTPVYHFDYTIVKMSMLKQEFGIQTAYNNYGDYSTILAYVFVNSHNIKTLYSMTYQHCPGKNRDIDHNINQNIPLFTVKWPILAILSIQFQASMNLNYGWKWYYGPDDVMTGCLIKFMPYFSSGLQAEGAVSIRIARAGMYAKGSIAQSYLAFQIQIKDAITPTSKVLGGTVSLTLEVNPFAYDIGAFYQLIKCSWKQFVHFHWRKMCSWGSQHQKSLINGKVGPTINKVLFSKTYQIKI